jgi:hypothetical protein
MTFSDPYMFVLVVSSVLCIPMALAIKTLLGTKEYVILPILRLCMTSGGNQTIVHQSSCR